MKDNKTNTANPFTDFMKSFQDGNMFNNVQQPNFDMSAMVNNQKRMANMFANINKVMSDGMQAIVRNSVENFQKDSSEAFKLIKDGSQNLQNPEQGAAQNAQTTKALCDRYLSECRNTMQMMNKLNMEVFDEVSKNLSENLDDACKVAKKNSKAS